MHTHSLQFPVTPFIFIVGFYCSILSTPAAAEYVEIPDSARQGMEITVYNSNLGLVKDVRSVTLPKGAHELRFTDVAAQINAPTVRIQSLSNPDSLGVLEQNYEYDLLSPDRLLDKFVGKTIKILLKNYYLDKEEIKDAELLSNNSGTVYKIGGEIHVNPPGQLIFPEIPENFMPRPTLVWLLENQSAEPHKLEVSYLTNGITWKADYTVVLSEKDSSADLSGWVTVDNQSGAVYRDAKIKLVAGDIHRVSDTGYYAPMQEAYAMRAPAAAPSFQEETFYEYHLYTLQRPSTIKDRQTKQIELLAVSGIPVRERLVYYGAAQYYRDDMSGRMMSNEKIGALIEIENKKENHLGMPLPKGTLRAYKKDSEGSLQLLGEDSIDHTPKDEKIEIKMGDSFDVVGERKQTDYRILSRDAGAKFHTEMEWEITVKNHKEKPVTVEVTEPLGGEWEIVSSSHPAEKLDAATARFVLTIQPDTSETLRYRVRIRWW